MSADRLREAAKAERDEWSGAENARLYPTASAIHLALADWLDVIATSWSDPHADDHTDLDGWHIEFEESTDTHGLRIADLILGSKP